MKTMMTIHRTNRAVKRKRKIKNQRAKANQKAKTKRIQPTQPLLLLKNQNASSNDVLIKPLAHVFL